MKLSERALLLVYTLLFTVVSFLMILVTIGWARPVEFIAQSIDLPSGRLSIGIVSFLLFILGLRLLFSSLNRRSDQQTTVQETSLGKVKVSLTAIENLVKKSVRQIKGIREVKVLVRAVEGKGIQIQMRIVISPEINVPVLTSDVQKNVKEYVKDVIGLDVADVSIIIDNIATDGKTV